MFFPDPGSSCQKSTGSRIRIRNTDQYLRRCRYLPHTVLGDILENGLLLYEELGGGEEMAPEDHYPRGGLHLGKLRHCAIFFFEWPPSVLL
jgi:hypothetical protein